MGKPSSPRSSPPKDRPLSAGERLFAYLMAVPGMTGVEAAQRAGYRGDRATLASTASRLMSRAKVAELVQELRAEVARKAESSAEAVLDEIRHVGMARLSRVIQANGSVKPLEQWGEHELAALDHLDLEEVFANPFANLPRMTDDGAVLPAQPSAPVGRLLTVKMRGKLKALELLAKHHGLVKDGAGELAAAIRGHAELVQEALRRAELQAANRRQLQLPARGEA